MAGLLDAEHQHDRDDHRHHDENDWIAFHKTPFAPTRLSLQAPSKNEAVQRRKVTCQNCELAKNQEQTESDQEASAGNFEHVHEPAEASIKFQEALNA